MLILYIILSVVLFILILLFLFSYLFHHKIFGHRFVANPTITLYTKEELKLKYKDIEFKCGKDILRGHIYYYDGYDESKIVIFNHGIWGNHNNYMQDIGYLCSKGLQVVGYDYTGVSTSDGKNQKGLGNSLRSLDYCVSYIKEQFKSKDIYIVGHSWGGFATSNITKYHPDVKGIVAMSPFISPYLACKSFLPKLARIALPFLYLIDILSVGKYSKDNSLKSLKNYHNKALFISSTDDPLVKHDINTAKIKEKYPNFSYIIMNNKKHNPNYTLKSVEKLTEYYAKMKVTSKKEMDEYNKTVNFHELGELDPVIMDQIVDFIKN